VAQLEGTDVTGLLAAWSQGDASALERLMPILYAELHAIASRHLRDEHAAHTLQTTALIHEAYLRLVGSKVDWQSQRHFVAATSRAMRRVLVDHARARQRLKRGGGALPITLQDVAQEPATDALDVIAIDSALGQLEQIDERKARAMELHFFGGLDYAEIAQLLGTSPATVHRDIRFASAWMHDKLVSGELHGRESVAAHAADLRRGTRVGACRARGVSRRGVRR
jgi:RNA polymerase sigma factor (TIGR02999 family)